MTAAATTQSTSLTARQLQFRAARRERQQCTKAAKIMAAAITTLGTKVDEDSDFTLDAYGRKCRISKPTDAEIGTALRGNRVLDSIELRELLGEQTIVKLISNGSLRRDPKHNPKSPCNLYWISVRASEVYGIPARVKLATGCEVDLVD